MTNTQKLKTRMQGATLRAFVAGHMSDEEARVQGYDPDAAREYHKIRVIYGRPYDQLKKAAQPEANQKK
jgi:hypothetical protein